VQDSENEVGSGSQARRRLDDGADLARATQALASRDADLARATQALASKDADLARATQALASANQTLVSKDRTLEARQLSAMRTQDGLRWDIAELTSANKALRAEGSVADEIASAARAVVCMNIATAKAVAASGTADGGVVARLADKRSRQVALATGVAKRKITGKLQFWAQQMQDVVKAEEQHGAERESLDQIKRNVEIPCSICLRGGFHLGDALILPCHAAAYEAAAAAAAADQGGGIVDLTVEAVDAAAGTPVVCSGHIAFCKVCLTMEMRTQINDRRRTFLCPDTRCRKEIGRSVISELGLLGEAVAMATPGAFPCRTPTCPIRLNKGSACTSGELAGLVVCSGCAIVHCAKCTHTDAEHSAWQLQQQDEEDQQQPAGAACNALMVADVHAEYDAMLQQVSSKVKACPGCFAAIEKNEGCNSMTCTNCYCEFCWRCGALLLKPGDRGAVEERSRFTSNHFADLQELQTSQEILSAIFPARHVFDTNVGRTCAGMQMNAADPGTFTIPSIERLVEIRMG